MPLSEHLARPDGPIFVIDPSRPEGEQQLPDWLRRARERVASGEHASRPAPQPALREFPPRDPSKIVDYRDKRRNSRSRMRAVD